MYPLFLILFFRHGITGCIPHSAFLYLIVLLVKQAERTIYKIKKTPQGKRGTYKLFDDSGRFVTEYKPGENGVTEVDILNLYKLDDHEVYVNEKFGLFQIELTK